MHGAGDDEGAAAIRVVHGEPVPLNCGGNCSNYVGEYQIFLSDGHWNLGDADRYATYRIEVVSFPFTPPTGPPDTVLRPMVMPDLLSYGYTDEGYGCTGWAWNSTDPYLPEPTRTLMREVRGDFTGSEGGGSAWMSDYQVLASDQMIAGGAPSACGDLGRRSVLPHTVLKHTVYLHDDGGVALDSVSWVYDHTRGRMRYYPFIDGPTNAKQYYDLCFRPFVRTDSAGHTYEATSNASWSGVAGGGTANYFPVPLNWEDLWQLYPTDLSEPFDSVSPADGPPPYALLEAPLLASNGSCYAGHAVDSVSGQMAELWGGAPWNEVPHTYVIDKPIDLRLINAQEKVIYNPSDVTIAMDSAYQGTPLVFPGGTTFRTVHGTHPSRADVEAVDPLGLLHPQLVPVPSTLGDSVSFYRIADGNTLVIEPCVTIMDAVIVVEAGGTLYYDDPVVDGNFTVVNQGGTVLPLSAVAPDKPCRMACLDDGHMEVKDVVVDSTTTWTVSTLPGDADADGSLKIGGTLHVRPGATLTIASGVELAFGPQGKVVVERDARLIADGVTFTNACWTMWHGVEVWGTKDASQSLNSGNQGYFRADNCVFEHAREAVRVYRSNDPTGEWEYNGGVVHLYTSVFRNNGRGVRIRHTRNRPPGGGADLRNQCSIQQCSFLSEGPLIEADLDHGQAEAGATPEHISLEGVFNVVVAHNQFSTVWPGTAPPPHRRGTGVFAYEASVVCHTNEFTGLSEGVWLEGAAAMTAHRIAYNAFADCIHSILMVGETYPAKILANTIVVPPSPEHGYADDDVNVGYDHPVGIYTLMSRDMHIEGNSIRATALDSSATRLSYGMVINRSNVNGSDPATSLAHMNSISGVHVAVQCEGRNKGVGAAGLMLECNTFGETSDVLRHDIVVVSNWISGDSLNFGLLRDQGSCWDGELQAGNSFSLMDADTATKDHLYFDDNTLADNPGFIYSDHGSVLPTEENIPVIMQCFLNNPRTCEPRLLATKGDLVERRNAYLLQIADTQEELEHEEDSLTIVALEHHLALLRAVLRSTENMLIHHMLEHETLDSLLEVLEEGAELQRWVPYYLAMGDLAAADSVIQLLVDAEGGDPSLTTQLYQLRLSVLVGLSQEDPAYVTWLRELIEADPYGAMAPKTLLRHLTREPYMRCPWKLNDDLPGIRSMEPIPSNTTALLDLTVYPNPTNRTFKVTLPADLQIRSARLRSIDGRLIPIAINGTELDPGIVAPGVYVVELGLSIGSVDQSRIIIRAP